MFNPAGIAEYPRHYDNWMNDIVDSHLRNIGTRNIISLVDPFVLATSKYTHFNWVAWAPIDSTPPAVENVAALKHAKRIWAMSRFGERELRAALPDANIDYVPHGVDTDVFKPIDRVEARKRWEHFANRDLEGRFIVTTVAANKGTPSRKNFWGMFEAFSLFLKDNPDALFYVHTDPRPSWSGDMLHHITDYFGISESVFYPSQYHYVTGFIGPELLNAIYNTSDVFMLLSMGEGSVFPLWRRKRRVAL